MAEPEPSLVTPYHSRRQVELAAALLLQDLGLQGAFAAPEEGEVSAEGLPERGAGPGTSAVVEHCDSTQPATQEEEQALLEEIFNTPDLPGQAEMVGPAEFRQAVALLVGLAALLGRAGSDDARREVLQGGTEAEPQLLYTVLTFLHQQLTGEGEPGERLGWLQEAATAVAQLLNSDMEHPFLAACSELCLEFLDDALASLGAVGAGEELRGLLVPFLARLGGSRALGRHAVRGILHRFTGIAEELREAQD